LKTLKISLVRHGEPEVQGVLLGHTDLALSSLGQQQLEMRFANLTYQRLITSPLQRCCTFAQQLAHKQNIKLEVNPDIKEMNFGDWDGKSYQELWNESPSLGDFWQNPHKVTPPNGETLLDFQQRINKWWQALIAEDKGDVVVLTHAGVIKQVLAYLFDDEEYVTIPNKIKINYAGAVNIEVKVDDKGNCWPTVLF
jgi:alpha-ribazole phosphatase